ncbi:transglutaminase domain-containing protein [Sporosarcina sp. YIM B06819]|uniref:transglutaminase domain-containing protein n=1 Tax=Sporosarcina sp. YIM B06819 TaxID=3081769 RepID=UPI00298C0EC8|nr:transglutaminase domain-containing protein [Sporosarcina sp. YIM B06819]
MKKLLTLSLSFVLASTLFIGTANFAHAAKAPAQPAVSAVAKTVKQSKSYSMILSALAQNDVIGQFDPTEITANEVGALINKVTQENPQVLYYKSANVWSNGKIEFAYSLPADVMKKNRVALDAKVKKVVASINKPGLSELDKVKAVHDYLVLNTEYDYANLQKNTIPADSYTAHGALLGGVAVCDGYTKAAQLLLNKLGIENHYVIGQIGDGLHSWNQVKLNDNYYFMDVTWNDPVPNRPGIIAYDYFLVTSNQLRKDHSWIEKNWAVATDKRYSYLQTGKTAAK